MTPQVRYSEDIDLVNRQAYQKITPLFMVDGANKIDFDSVALMYCAFHGWPDCEISPDLQIWPNQQTENLGFKNGGSNFAASVAPGQPRLQQNQLLNHYDSHLPNFSRGLSGPVAGHVPCIPQFEIRSIGTQQSRRHRPRPD